MNTTEFVKKLSEKQSLVKIKSEEVLKSVMSIISEGLKNDGIVKLGELGNLKITQRAARKGRNPQNGEEIDIPASTTVVFRISKSLKEELNKK